MAYGVWRSLSPNPTAPSYALTTSHHPKSTDGRAGTDRTCDRNANAVLRTILSAVCGDGGGVRRGPRAPTSFGPQHELPTDRPRPMNDVRGHGKIQLRSVILAYYASGIISCG